MTPWHIKATRDLIRHRHGPDQLMIVRNAVRAATVRLDHARYHFKELRRLLREHIDDKLVERDIYDLALPGAPGWDALEEGLVQVEANMIACAQAIHAIPYALAHVAFFSAGLNLLPKPIREDRLSLKVLLQAGALSAAGWLDVERCLAELANDPAFVALDAVVNYNKHRGLPDPALHLEPENHPAPYAMQFESFSYGGTVRPRIEVEKLLAPAYAAVSQGVVRTGNAINSLLA